MITSRRLTISLPDELVAKIDRIAVDANRSRSNAIARLIQLAPEPKPTL